MPLNFFEIFGDYYKDGIANKYEIAEITAYKKITREQFTEITELDFMETLKEGYLKGEIEKDTLDIAFKNKVITLDEYNNIINLDKVSEEASE